MSDDYVSVPLKIIGELACVPKAEWERLTTSLRQATERAEKAKVNESKALSVTIKLGEELVATQRRARLAEAQAEGLATLLETALDEYESHNGKINPERMPNHWTVRARQALSSLPKTES